MCGDAALGTMPIGQPMRKESTAAVRAAMADPGHPRRGKGDGAGAGRRRSTRDSRTVVWTGPLGRPRGCAPSSPATGTSAILTGRLAYAELRLDERGPTQWDSAEYGSTRLDSRAKRRFLDLGLHISEAIAAELVKIAKKIN